MGREWLTEGQDFSKQVYIGRNKMTKELDPESENLKFMQIDIDYQIVKSQDLPEHLPFGMMEEVSIIRMFGVT